MSPELKEIYHNNVEDTNVNLEKSDLFFIKNNIYLKCYFIKWIFNFRIKWFKVNKSNNFILKIYLINYNIIFSKRNLYIYYRIVN